MRSSRIHRAPRMLTIWALLDKVTRPVDHAATRPCSGAPESPLPTGRPGSTDVGSAAPLMSARPQTGGVCSPAASIFRVSASSRKAAACSSSWTGPNRSRHGAATDRPQSVQGLVPALVDVQNAGTGRAPPRDGQPCPIPLSAAVTGWQRPMTVPARPTSLAVDASATGLQKRRCTTGPSRVRMADCSCTRLCRGRFPHISRKGSRSIDLDDELLASAQRELNTTGVSDTVRAALQQAASAAVRARQLRWLPEGGLEAMADPAQRADVWR